MALRFFLLVLPAPVFDLRVLRIGLVLEHGQALEAKGVDLQF